jgi:hypothetical protein
MRSVKLIVLWLIIAIKSNSQITNPKIFEAKKIYFYGYDFNHFKFIDTKSRASDLVKDCLNGWVTFVNEKHGSQKKLSKALDKEVIINYDPTQSRYSKIDMSERMGVGASYVNKDSIDTYVSRYVFPDKEGIGLIVFIDCFYKPDKLCAMTYVFFDIATKEVLSKVTAESNNADGHGLVNCWGVGMNITIAEFWSIYSKAEKNYLKSTAKK